jgi:hypothetical protein
MLDKEQLKSHENDVDLYAMAEDNAGRSEPVYAVKSEGTIAPIEKAGNPDLEKFSECDRFAISHEEITDKDSVLNKTLKMSVDKPSD